MSCCIEPLAGPIVMVGVSMASSGPPNDHLIGGTPPRCTPAAPAPSGGSGASGPPGSKFSAIFAKAELLAKAIVTA